MKNKLFIGDEIHIYTQDDGKKCIDIFIGNLSYNICYILWIMSTISLNKVLTEKLKKYET